MRKNIICLFIVSMLLTGCTVEYNLNIDSNSIQENINIGIDSIENLPEDSYSQLTSSTNKVYFDEEEYYTVNYKNNDNRLFSEFNYKHNLDKYNNATVLDLCYPNRTVKKDQNQFEISTTGSFACAFTEFGDDIRNANINITTKLKVIENNADKINGNTYTWIINQENYTDKPIKIIMELPKDNTALIKSTKESILIYAVFIVPITIVLLYLVWKKKRINKL